MKKLLPLLFIFFCVALSATFAQGLSSLKKEGTEKEARNLPPFEKVQVSGGGRFYFHHAPFASMEIKRTGPCREPVEVEVVDNTLYVYSAGADGAGCETKIYIGTPSLNEIRLKSGGNVEIAEGFPAVERFYCRQEGGGRVFMRSLQVDSLFASIEGGGELNARVSKFLQGKISGGGVIYYKGSPVVESELSGGGLIKRK